MNFFFDQLRENALNLLGIFLSVFAVYWSYRYQASKEPKKQQLRVYLPMFRILEPHLYRSAYTLSRSELQEISKKIGELIDKHYELIHPSIVHWSRLLERELARSKQINKEIDKTFAYLCSLIDREFEKTRRRLFLPTRGILYRLNNRQYDSKGKMFLGALKWAVYQLSFLLAIASLAIWIAKIIGMISK